MSTSMSTIHSLAAAIDALPEYSPPPPNNPDPDTTSKDNQPQQQQQQQQQHDTFPSENDINAAKKIPQAEIDKWAWAWSSRFPQPIWGRRTRSRDGRYPTWTYKQKVALQPGISIAKISESQLPVILPGVDSDSDSGSNYNPAEDKDATIVTRIIDSGGDILGIYSSATGPPPPLPGQGIVIGAAAGQQETGDGAAAAAGDDAEPPAKRSRWRYNTRSLPTRQADFAVAEEKRKQEEIRKKICNAKIVKEPWAEGYTVPLVGGSAAGAALVKSGIVDTAVGIDGGGAGCVRVAASLLGCNGFKPTRGVIPMTGIMPGTIMIHTNSVGVLSDNAFEMAYAMDVLAGDDGIDPAAIKRAHGEYGFGPVVNLQVASPPGGARWDRFKIGLVLEAFGLPSSSSTAEPPPPFKDVRPPWDHSPGSSSCFGGAPPSVDDIIVNGLQHSGQTAASNNSDLGNNGCGSGGGGVVFQYEVIKHVLAAVTRMKDQGAKVEWISVPEHKDGLAILTIQQKIAAAASFVAAVGLGPEHPSRAGEGAARKEELDISEYEGVLAALKEEDLAIELEKLSPEMKKDVLEGTYLCKNFPGIYAKSVNIGRRIRDAYERVFDKYGAVMMPTTPCILSKRGTGNGTVNSRGTGAGEESDAGLAFNTSVFSVTGHPAMSVCVGNATVDDCQGGFVRLPVGMQIVCKLERDFSLLRIASEAQCQFHWL